VHVADPTPQQEAVAAWCAERAERRHLDAGNDTPDPVIAILGTARAAALHPATISTETCKKYRTHGFTDLAFRWDEPNEKLITAAEQIAKIHHHTRHWTYPDSERPGAAQVVFCDAGVPNPDGSPSVYSTSPTCSPSEASPAARSPGSTTSLTRTGASRCGTRSAPATPGS
jgi:hypothetical protein